MSGPCEGLIVVEVAVGTSDLGLGLAGGAPGMLLAELGADVTRVIGQRGPAIDRDLTWSGPWHRGKRLVTVVDDDPQPILELLLDADVALVYGPEELVEGRGLGYRELHERNPGLIVGRCRPSRLASGPIADYALLVEARTGFCTQLAGHRPGPIFVDVRAPGAGAAFLLTASVLTLLQRRVSSGTGGWAETSLYDGMLATLGCMIGRPEQAPPDVEHYWEHGSTFPNFLYRCADGELIQVWFGGKGMYPALLEVLGDEPSPEGYYTDQITGALKERAVRWVELFTAETREVWIERLRAAGVACEPVLGPGEALADPHLAEIGLAVPSGGCSATGDGDATSDGDGAAGEVMVGSPISVEPLVPGPGVDLGDAGRGLEGLRVVDFSAFVAGPLGAQVLADLGADVIKVEPPGGEAMRAAAYAVAACQRGKRSLALDITAAEAGPVVDALLEWADVVLHNFRVGVSTRLGIDEDTVAARRSDAVYCHASAFGNHGPRAKMPGNDALMQALTGFERVVGGAGNDPLAATWIPIDMSGGWVAAIGILAGLYRRAVSGRGQRVSTSLLGAGMLLQSGVYQRDGEVVTGPTLDAGQTGYGPGYRLYQSGDGTWLAVAVPDEAAWAALWSAVAPAAVPAAYVPLRRNADDAEAAEAEAALEEAFAEATGAEWCARLAGSGVLLEPVAELDRDEFRRGLLDDPVNRQLGRVAAYHTDAWGHFEQIGPLLRLGPEPSGGPRLMIPGVGEHTREVLAELGIGAELVEQLLDAGIARQLDD